MRFNSLFLIIPLGVAIAATARPLSAQSTSGPDPAASAEGMKTALQQFTVEGLDCPKCAIAAEAAMNKMPGVSGASVQFPTGAARVVTATPLSREQLQAILGPLGYSPRFAGDPPEIPLTEAEKAGLDIAVVGKGKRLDYDRLPAAGKVTIVDFFGDWCGPCRLLGPRLEHLVKANPHVALRKVDLAAWDSATAAQASDLFHFSGLPYVRVYGPDGKFLGAVSGVQMNEINRLIALGVRP